MSATTNTAATKAPKAHDHKPKPKPNPSPDPKNQLLRPLQTYPGTVGAYEANPDGVYDRFTLEAPDAPGRTVKFAPHFGEELRQLAQAGQPVTVLGYLHATPKGDEHLHLARVEAAGTTAQPGGPDAVTVAGTVAALRHTPKGDLHGLLLAGHDTELRLPPHLGQQLTERLVVGAALTASGRQRPLKPGEVAAHPAPVQVELLLVGDEAFLLR